MHILYALMKEFHTVEESFVQPGVLAVLADHGVPDTLAASIVLTARRGLELVEATIGEGQIGKFSAAQVFINIIIAIAVILIIFINHCNCRLSS